jgi:hypothetical protein
LIAFASTSVMPHVEAGPDADDEQQGHRFPVQPDVAVGCRRQQVLELRQHEDERDDHRGHDRQPEIVARHEFAQQRADGGAQRERSGDDQCAFPWYGALACEPDRRGERADEDRHAIGRVGCDRVQSDRHQDRQRDRRS